MLLCRHSLPSQAVLCNSLPFPQVRSTKSPGNVKGVSMLQSLQLLSFLHSWVNLHLLFLGLFSHVFPHKLCHGPPEARQNLVRGLFSPLVNCCQVSSLTSVFSRKTSQPLWHPGQLQQLQYLLARQYLRNILPEFYPTPKDNQSQQYLKIGM